MCLIVTKPKGVPLPKRKLFKQWFDSHDDGFGLAFTKPNGKAHILKGAMTEKEMITLLSRLPSLLNGQKAADVAMIFHFRQATDGSVTPANCHPFPISKKEKVLASLDVETNCALVHNGIVWDYASAGYPNLTGKTDTQRFIEEILADLGGNLFSLPVQKLIAGYSDNSRFALLSKKGITLIGQFIKENGLYFSNGGYKFTAPAPSFKTYGRYQDSPNYKGYQQGYGKEGFIESTSAIQRWGKTCDFCEVGGHVLYSIPNDSSAVCFECYAIMEGQAPTMDELCYSPPWETP